MRDSPHYSFLDDTDGGSDSDTHDTGSHTDMDDDPSTYATYYAMGAATGALVEDHSLQAFLRLASKFR